LTKAEFINSPDGLPPGPNYGNLIMTQILARLQLFRSPYLLHTFQSTIRLLCRLVRVALEMPVYDFVALRARRQASGQGFLTFPSWIFGNAEN
jgi:hypothetical protein